MQILQGTMFTIIVTYIQKQIFMNRHSHCKTIIIISKSIFILITLNQSMFSKNHQKIILIQRIVLKILSLTNQNQRKSKVPKWKRSFALKIISYYFKIVGRSKFTSFEFFSKITFLSRSKFTSFCRSKNR